MKTCKVVWTDGGRVVARDKAGFFYCRRYKDGTYHRNGGGGLHVESRDLDYIARGAARYDTPAAALLAHGGWDTHFTERDYTPARLREGRPRVGRFWTGARFMWCLIGTDYGYLHTSSGDVRTWKSESGARHALKRLYNQEAA